MNKLRIVFLFHLKEGFRSKAVIITAAILFVGILGILGFGQVTKEDQKESTVAIISTSQKYSIEENELALDNVKVIQKDKQHLLTLKKQVEKGELDGIIQVEEQESKPLLTYTYKTFPNNELLAVISQYVQQKYLNTTIIENDIRPETAVKLLTPVEVKRDILQDSMKTAGIVYVFVFLIYMLIVIFGQSIATTVAAEKSSRVMEIIIPKVRPVYMMYGKIFSMLIIGLFQIIIIAAAYGLGYLLGWIDKDNLKLFGMLVDLSQLTPAVMLAFVLYFVLGYIVYAMLYAAVGSVVSRTEDISAVSMPVTGFIIAALFIGIKSMTDPNSTLVIVSSYIPLFSPIITFSRIVAGEAGLGEIIITTVLLVGTIIVLNKFTSRIYINGVMNYREKVNWKDFIHFVNKQ
ncbi:ABC transporter permease [Bacillus sp. 165]|uniref:ABC transporter permease n=1 Tax=Bacillus sp. 165 TaxID=1529117 RepID=UPI001AD9FFE0|nr:ABC transporter permease [Bacillus sp. 165]MBO9130361.1 ABC transporter permease [Bacillus sp. 165]